MRDFPGKLICFWALSGIIHFALGRTWAYRSLQLLGSNRSNIVTSLSPIATVALAMLILKETVTPLQFVGITLYTIRATPDALQGTDFDEGSPMKSGSHGKEVDAHTLFLGVFYGAGAALFWGSSAIFIKFGLEAGGTPVAGTLIAYAAASVVISPSFLFSAEKRRETIQGGQEALADSDPQWPDHEHCPTLAISLLRLSDQ